MTLRALGLVASLLLSVSAPAADPPPAKKGLVESTDGSGVQGYKDTPIQPWSGYHTHDPDRPKPPKVESGRESTQEKTGTAPSDAVILFDGKDMAAWKPAEWKIEDGSLVAGKGLLTTLEEFGDFQLHVEWQAPNPPVGGPMDRGNNGVMLLGMTEIQVFDSYESRLYPDGQAAAIYAQTPPLVNATRKPGEWQSYDIIVSAPVWKDGKLDQPMRVTMLHNGVAVHVNQEVYGTTPHRGLAKYPDQRTKGPISLMGHNNPVKFRNIWVRKIDKTVIAPKG